LLNGDSGVANAVGRLQMAKSIAARQVDVLPDNSTELNHIAIVFVDRQRLTMASHP
jgi:hypothetical protein